MLVKDLLICFLVALIPFLWYMLSVWACWLMLTNANNASSHNRTKQLLWSNSNQIFRCYIFQNLTCLLTKLDVKLLSFHTLQWKFHYQYDYINAMSQSIHYKWIFTNQGKKWLTSFSAHHLSPRCCSWHFISSVWKTYCPVTCITFCAWAHQTWGLFIGKKFQGTLQTFVI